MALDEHGNDIGGTSNPVGRPPMYASAEDIAGKADGYFLHIRGESETVVNESGETEIRWKRRPEPPTITGLALFLGFASRQSFYDYCDKGGQFAYALQKARMMIECEYEKNLHGTTPTGSIFALKNMGWKDRSDVGLGGMDGEPLPAPIINVITKPKNDE